VDFLGSLGTGLGTIGGFVPGVGTGLGLVGAGLTLLAGKPDALALNPYWSGVFRPGEALWGVEQNATEISGAAWELDPGGPLRPYQPGRDADPGEIALLNLLGKESRRRGAVERMVGHKIWVPGSYPEPGRLVKVTFARADDNSSKVMRVDLVNALVARLQARVTAHGNADPVFPYIDLRPWSEYAADSWMDAGAPNLGFKFGKSNAQLIDLWRSGAIANPTWKAKRDKAYADFLVDHASEQERYAKERATWLEWRRGIDQAAREQQQAQQIEQAIHDYYQNAADKDLAAQAIANGEVHFALGHDTASSSASAGGASGPSNAVASGPPGTPQPPSDDKHGMVIMLGALALGALLIMGAKR
jgi:hypothetical protein